MSTLSEAVKRRPHEPKNSVNELLRVTTRLVKTF